MPACPNARFARQSGTVRFAVESSTMTTRHVRQWRRLPHSVSLRSARSSHDLRDTPAGDGLVDSPCRSRHGRRSAGYGVSRSRPGHVAASMRQASFVVACPAPPSCRSFIATASSTPAGTTSSTPDVAHGAPVVPRAAGRFGRRFSRYACRRSRSGRPHRRDRVTSWCPCPGFSIPRPLRRCGPTVPGRDRLIDSGCRRHRLSERR